MGRVGTVLKLIAEKIRATLGGGDEQIVERVGPAGMDALPLQGDKIFLVSGQHTGSYKSLGALKKAPQISAGETLIYSRDSGGTKTATIYLRNDGGIEISSLKDVNVNDAVITPEGDVITGIGISLNSHVHPGVTVGAGITGGPQGI